VFGNMQSANYNEFYKALAQAGGRFLSADGKKAEFNSPAGVQAANWLLEKYGTVMPTEKQGVGTPDYDKNLFMDGKLAMWHTGMWMFGPLATTKATWDIAVEPAGPGGEEADIRQRCLRLQDLTAPRRGGEVAVPHRL
jgi:multiple sugar transport system substrate-binding protein